MKKFDYDKECNSIIDTDIVNLLTSIHEYKGKQELYFSTQPDVLSKLVDISKIQSTDASNRIEGIRTSDSRLKELMEKKTEPRNRNEEEIAGYRYVLDMIHESHDYIPISVNDVLSLHKYLYKFNSTTNIGGKLKTTDNIIQETDENGNSFVRFKPASAFLTPQYLQDMCSSYNKAIEKGIIDPLILIPCFILDFLCIHPFDDGNGRMSRLLTLLLLYKSNYFVGKYISLEMIIEKSKETYYDSLQASSVRWNENENDYKPFLRYTLGVVLNAYREFEDRFKTVYIKKEDSITRVLNVISKSYAKLNKNEIISLCPEFSKKSIERALGILVKENKIIKVGINKSTAYVLNREKKE